MTRLAAMLERNRWFHHVPVRHIGVAICAVIDVKYEAFSTWQRGGTPRRVTTMSRTIAVGLLRMSGMSYPEIARALGASGHSSVHTRCQAWLALSDEERDYWTLKVLGFLEASLDYRFNPESYSRPWLVRYTLRSRRTGSG